MMLNICIVGDKNCAFENTYVEVDATTLKS